MDAPDAKSLPENAYKPLAPGETYAPIVPAGAKMPRGDGYNPKLHRSSARSASWPTL